MDQKKIRRKNSPSNLKKSYSRLAPRYNYLVRKASYQADIIVATWCIKYFKHGKAKVLDLGCGTGLSAKEFFKVKYEVTGVDIAPGMIKEAKKFPFKKLICQNLEEKIKVKDNYFDIINLVSVTELINRPLAVFKEVYRKLKPNGIFALTVVKKLKRESKMPIYSYTKKEIGSLFRESNFKIIDSKEFLGWRNKLSNYNEPIYYRAYLLKKN